ncbi:hypothetical protein M747DRAFT_359342 [Aspergillus niger ATCC 13496]|uniref:Uncharacterized protein n=1 Tax=Aspergillus niger ATCC 13496 TaxID=1353008 RepID=A0A370BKI6_ASPNG|nr:hypothetical protein M747DRAFT_359342 [Aspergillus niger ATCC 13496]
MWTMTVSHTILSHILLSQKMCFYQIYVYSCGCTTPGPFKQCLPCLGTNVRCTKLGLRQRELVGNYCPRHLVTRGARIVYVGPGGQWQSVAGEGGQGAEAEEAEAEEEDDDDESDNNGDEEWRP